MQSVDSIEPVLINGRYLTQPVSGIQRFAHETVRALDSLLTFTTSQRDVCPVILVAPRGVLHRPELKTISLVECGRLHGHLWEQVTLPRLARRSVLLSLCQVGPLLTRRQIVVMHDASVFAMPMAFSPAFRRWYQFVLPVLARRVTKVLTVSEFSQKELNRYRIMREQAAPTVPESGEHILRVQSDATLLERHGLRRGTYAFVVSNLSPNKNFSLVAEAMKLIPSGPWRFVVAGRVDRRVAFGTAKIPSCVTYVGAVTDGQLRALYENAGCFLYPSLYEGFGLPPLEAMTCGCPVIVARTASFPEVLGDAVLYCDPQSPDSLAAQIVRVMTDHDLREELRARGFVHAARYTWARCAQEIWKHVLETRAIV